jgi:hypothetical protein
MNRRSFEQRLGDRMKSSLIPDRLAGIAFGMALGAICGVSSIANMVNDALHAEERRLREAMLKAQFGAGLIFWYVPPIRYYGFDLPGPHFILHDGKSYEYIGMSGDEMLFRLAKP